MRINHHLIQNYPLTTKFTLQFSLLLLIKTGISQVMVGKYERGDALSSIEVAKKIADAFQVSLDYLVGEGQNARFDKLTLKRIEELELLDEDKKKTLYDLIDTYIRDAKNRATYAM